MVTRNDVRFELTIEQIYWTKALFKFRGGNVYTPIHSLTFVDDKSSVAHCDLQSLIIDFTMRSWSAIGMMRTPDLKERSSGLCLLSRAVLTLTS